MIDPDDMPPCPGCGETCVLVRDYTGTAWERYHEWEIECGGCLLTFRGCGSPRRIIGMDWGRLAR